VVTSTATTEKGVLEDLFAEARQLPSGSSQTPLVGQVTTTVLVCPFVPAWADFGDFDDFFVDELDGGEALASRFDVTVVAFHPRYALHSPLLEEGDRVAVPCADGTEVYGTVVARIAQSDGDSDDENEQLVRVSLDDGEERTVTFPAQDESCDWANMASRSPRPCLHLLRKADLDRVRADDQAVLERRDNCEHCMRQLGAEGVESLLLACN